MIVKKILFFQEHYIEPDSQNSVLRVVVVVMQSQRLKSLFLQIKIGVLVGKKHDEISGFSQSEFRKRRRILERILKNA